MTYLPGLISIQRLRRALFVVGVAGAILCAVGFSLARQQFFISYLFSYVFWFGIGSGCLGILMLYELTGGAWGDIIQTFLEAGSLTLPWLSLLFIPLLFGLSDLYPWARPDQVAADPLLQHKHLYLNVPFFLIRAVLFFVLWSFMAQRLVRWRSQGEAGQKLANRRSAPGLVLYFVTLTFALIDWLMSLEPHWYSTTYSAMVIIGQVLAAFAFLICVLAFFEDPDVLNRMEAKALLDLGNMVLAFVMLWAYLSFSQYLIIWSANLPDEISWYLHRQKGGWFWVAMTVIVFQFFLPFLILLGRINKQKIERLVWIAGLLLFLSVIHTFWLVEPAFHPESLRVHWLDLAAFLSVGGFWTACFLRELEQRGPKR